MKRRRTLTRLSEEQILRVVQDYQTSSFSVRDVVARNGISKDTLMEIVRSRKIPERGRSRVPVPICRNGLRMARTPVITDIVLERAKLALRKRGWVVYAAEVTDGSRGKGFFRCDGKLWTRQQVLEAASK